MDGDKVCSICQQPFKARSRVGKYGFKLKSDKNQRSVCSPVCSQSLQYCIGVAHGFILLHVLRQLCGNVSSWKGGTATASVSHENNFKNSSCRKTVEDRYSDPSVKREPQYVSHFEDEVSDLKVFFDPGECSDSEQEFTSLFAESLEEDHMSGLHTPPQNSQETDLSQIVSKCISKLSSHNADATQTVKALTGATIQCHFCHSKFPPGEYQGLAEHLCEVHTKDLHKDIICDICGTLFRERKLLQRHKKNIHGIHITEDESDRINRHKCDKCNKAFSAQDYLQEHRRRSHSISKQTPEECNVCRKTFINKVLLKQHMKSDHEPEGESQDKAKKWYCYRCNKEYPTRVRLQRHNQFVHSKQTAVVCTVCGKSFRNKLLLKHHVQFLHSKQTPSDCQVCGKTYRNMHLLKMHVKVVHKVKVIRDNVQETLLQCVYCAETFSTGSQDAIANHLAEFHNKEVSPSLKLSCDICGARFKKKVYLTRHMKKIHDFGSVASNGVERKSKKESDKKRYPCDKCGKTYTRSALSKHIRIYHTTHEPVNCDVCGKTLINSFHLDQHKRQHVPTKICHICGANFKTDAGLRGHLAAHKGTKSHICEVCGMGFVRKTSWQRHVKLHTETIHFQCDCCPKAFKTVYSLNTHMLSKHHRGAFFHNRLKTLEEVGYVVDKEAVNRHLSNQCTVCSKIMEGGMCPAHPDDCMLLFRCQYCELVVSHIDDLCLHLKKHNIPLAFTASTRNFTASWSAKRDDSDMDYSCQVCHKSFQRRESLAGHMKQHKEKAFECHICLKKFTYKCNMKNHLRTHSEDKPFQCELCQKAFKCKQLLNNHRLVHNLNESPFKCQICGKGLTRKFFLQRHYRQMHPGVTL